jgi:ABC-2 type transport system ATP-binding protein
MRDLIRELSSDATIILSTHVMQEVDAVCDRVLILRSGELALDARLDELRDSNLLVVKSGVGPEAAMKLLLPLDGVTDLDAYAENHYRVTIDRQAGLDDVGNRIARALVENNHPLYELKPERRDLESVFREVNEQPQGEVRHAA